MKNDNRAGLNVTKVEGHGSAAIYDALTLAIVGLNGIVCEPRCEIDDGQALNQAGEYIEAIQSFLLDERRRVIAAAKATLPKDFRDWNAINSVVLRQEFDDNDWSMAESAALAL